MRKAVSTRRASAGWSRRGGLAFGLGLVAVLGTGCLVTPVQRRQDTLIREARMWSDDLRWARWEAVTAAMPGEDGAAFLGRVEALGEELVLADYEVTAINFAAGSEAATVISRFDWYLRRDGRLRTTTVEQRWELKSGRWQVIKLRRTRGDRLALITEPTAAK